MVTAARAQAQRVQIEAEAQAKATRLAAEAEAEAIRIKALAASQVADPFARDMEFRRMEVQRVRAYGQKAVFVPDKAAGQQMADYYSFGLAAGMGGVNARDLSQGKA